MDISTVGLTALVLISAFSGLIVGSTTIFMFMSRLVKDQKATDATEQLLGALVPESTLLEVSALAEKGMELADKYGEQLIQATKDFLTFAKNVTDRQPNVLEVRNDEEISS